jgi:hypothetical protein
VARGAGAGGDVPVAAVEPVPGARAAAWADQGRMQYAPQQTWVHLSSIPPQFGLEAGLGSRKWAAGGARWFWI